MRTLLILLALCAFSGCQVAPVYVQADRATFNAVAPEYLEYVEADPALSSEQRELRRATIESWRRRLEAGEAVAGPAAPSPGGR